MFCFILFVGLLCFSEGQSNIVAPAAIRSEEMTTKMTPLQDWTTTQSPDPPVIAFLRIAVISAVNLSSDSTELQLFVQKITSFIPQEYRATTKISVKSIQKVPNRNFA